MRSRTLLAVLALLAAPAAHAVLTDEIQVYTDDLNAPGELSMELHLNATPSGRRTPDFPNEVTPHHGLRVTPEISLGLARDVDGALYLPMVRDADGRLLFGGPKLRLKWLPLRPAEGGAGWFAGLNGEYAWLNRNFETGTRSAELRPILGWRDPLWLFSVNPVLDWTLNGPDKAGRPGFAPALKAARTVAEGLALGLEYYADLGPLGRPLPREEQSRTLYAAMEWARGPVPVHFAVGRGTGAADKWTVKAILEFSFGTK